MARGFITERRGFLLVTVLLLLIIAVLMTTWVLRRTTMQSLVAQRRYHSYTEHHELLGMRALADRWIKQQGVDLAELAERGGEIYRADLPNGSVVTMAIADGQGRLLARVEDVESDAARARLVRALRRLPPDRPDLVRAFGPAKVSVASAPDEVIDAIAGDDDVLARVLADVRVSEPENDGDLIQQLNSADYEQAEVQELTQLLTVSPTLWRLDVDVRDERGTRRYEILALTEGNIPLVVDSRPAPVDDRVDNRRRRSR